MCGWAGAIFEVTRQRGQEQWGPRNKIIKKVKCDRPTNRRTKRVVESRARDLKQSIWSDKHVVILTYSFKSFKYIVLFVYLTNYFWLLITLKSNMTRLLDIIWPCSFMISSLHLLWVDIFSKCNHSICYVINWRIWSRPVILLDLFKSFLFNSLVILQISQRSRKVGCTTVMKKCRLLVKWIQLKLPVYMSRNFFVYISPRKRLSIWREPKFSIFYYEVAQKDDWLFDLYR